MIDHPRRGRHSRPEQNIAVNQTFSLMQFDRHARSAQQLRIVPTVIAKRSQPRGGDEGRRQPGQALRTCRRKGVRSICFRDFEETDLASIGEMGGMTGSFISDHVELGSRHQGPMTRYFPELVPSRSGQDRTTPTAT
jgi:hypothetical protein